MGMVFLSFFGQLHALRVGVADPAPVSSEWVLIVKGLGFVLVLLGLITSLRRLPAKN